MAQAGARRVCVVAGLGGGGIGDSCAKLFSQKGYHVAMLARTKANLDLLEGQIANSRGYVCDVGDHAQVESVVPRIEADLGAPISVLIFNAGVGMFKPFKDTSVDDFELCWRSGPAALFNFSKVLAPRMAELAATGTADPIAIGVTGAAAGWRGMPATSALAPAKFALRALSQSMAREFGPKGVHVFHVVIDGLIFMDKTRAMMPEKPEAEFIKPQAVADTYWYLTSQDRTSWSHETNLCSGALFGGMLNI